jgi:spore coat protein U-like protein
VWGDGSAGTQIVSGISTGFSTPISLTVYGRIPDSAANQATTPGAYSDTILVVMTY